MLSYEMDTSQSLVTNCLNRLQAFKSKFQHYSRSQIQSFLYQMTKDLKSHLHTICINKQSYRDMEKQIRRLNEINEKINNKHKQILQHLEILIYQKDFTQLAQRIGEYQKLPLENSNIIWNDKQEKVFSSQLDRAFVQDVQKQESFLLSDLEDKNDQSPYQKNISIVKHALSIINNEEEPFERKQQVWLNILDKQNQSSGELHHVKDKEILFTKQKLKQLEEFSEINITERCELQPFKKNNKNPQLFSGKKIKSMIILKQKSAKSKGTPKTSLKKSIVPRKQTDNIEVQEEKMKKKLVFTPKLITQLQRSQKDIKGKGRKSEIKGAKSYKKTIISQF